MSVLRYGTAELVTFDEFSLCKINDNYVHADEGLAYTVESIPGPSDNSKEYEVILNEYNSQISDHCDCTKFCTNDCSCLKRSGGSNYIVTVENGIRICRLTSENNDDSISPILECNSLCKCSKECGNRLVLNGPIDGLVVKTCSETKGLGLFTENFILKGSFVCEYAGEILTKAEALRRHSINKIEGKMNYIYCLKEHSGGKIVETFIDPSFIGNIGRYINHSCDPNCIIIPVRVDTLIPKLAIFSSKDIPSNTELNYDYSSCDIQSDPINVTDRKQCFCKSFNCKGWMPFEKY